MSSETNRCTRRVTGGEDDNYHFCQRGIFDLANERNRIRQIDSTSNTISTSQLSAIISRGIYNEWRDRTPETPIRVPKAKSTDEFRVSTVITSCLLIERIPATSIGVYTDSPRNLEEAHLRRHSTANCTYEYVTRAKHTYGDR
jgi:hypothetical protein